MSGRGSLEFWIVQIADETKQGELGIRFDTFQ